MVNSALLEFPIGGLASCIAEALTLPMDTVKVRLQLDSTASINSMIKSMIKEEGLISFFNGLSPALLRQLLYGSLRYGLYPFFKKFYFPNFHSDELNLFQKLISGLSAGAISSAICNPTDLIKVRMQASRNKLIYKDSDARNKDYIDYQYSSIYNAFKTIIHNEGYLALYTGVGPTVCRASVLAAVEMTTYDNLKSRIAIFLNQSDQSFIVHAVTALIASFFSALASNPFDMARSRVMNQPRDKNGRGLIYKGAIDCIFKVVQKEGILALFAGFWAFFLRLGPNTMLTFMVMEQLRHLANIMLQQ